MKRLVAMASVGLAALVAEADVMLYWTVTESDFSGSDFYSEYTSEQGYLPILYASIDGGSAESGYTAIDAITLGSAVDTKIGDSTVDGSYDSYIIRLYNANGVVAESSAYTYSSLVTSSSSWSTDVLGMKAMTPFTATGFTPVPEPTGGLLALLGLAGLALRRRRA